MTQTNEADYQLQLDIIDSTDESCYRNWKKKDLLIACYLVIKQEFGSIRWSNYVETESMW